MIGWPPSSDPCLGALAEGWMVGLRPFVGEGDDRILEQRTGEGLDARYTLDLERLGADDLVVPAERFYLRTGAPRDLGDGVGYALALDGRVQDPVALPIEALLAEVRPIGVLHFECSGNADGSRFGLMSAGDFAGVPLADILTRVAPLAGATAIRITGLDDHPDSDKSVAGSSWVFRPEWLAEAWLVTHQDGAPIPRDHGWPVRLVVPGWYGCANTKWVTAITWVDDDEPATSQMREFAARTHQPGVPELARDYLPALTEVSAVPIRVERWAVEGAVHHRVVGVVWGGQRLPDTLRLWADDRDLGPVGSCPPRAGPRTWGLWEALLPDDLRGEVELRVTVDDPDLPSLRLDQAYYARVVDLG